jgi:hypothetical protein
MTNREELSRVLGELHGLTIEIVSNPIGSIIRVEMGPLEIPSDEPDASPRGLRRLTILSPWRLQSPDEVICDWTDPGGSGGQLRELLSVLQGQTVESAAAPGPAHDITLRLSSGHQLISFSDVDDTRDNAWFLLGGDGLALEVAPRRKTEGGWRISWSGARTLADERY